MAGAVEFDELVLVPIWALTGFWLKKAIPNFKGHEESGSNPTCLQTSFEVPTTYIEVAILPHVKLYGNPLPGQCGYLPDIQLRHRVEKYRGAWWPGHLDPHDRMYACGVLHERCQELATLDR